VNQQEVSGSLANGGTYRATGYMVELRDSTGTVVETVDANEIAGVQRNGQRVIIKRRKGRDVAVEASTLDDAGQLELTLRGPVTGAAAAPAKKRGIGRVALIGCGGLLALVVVITVAASLAGGGDDSTSSSSAGAEPRSGDDVRVPLAEGSSGTVKTAGDKVHRVTVIRVLDNAQSANQFSQPQAGMKYWAVEMLVENAGTSEISTSLQWKLRGSNDFEYDRTFVSGVGQNFELAQNLTPGAKTQGVVVFEIPSDVSPKWLRYDPNTFARGDLYFDAQPQQ
jgi:hypothetical protein